MMKITFLQNQRILVVFLLSVVLATAANAYADSEEQIAAAKECSVSAKLVAPYGNMQLDSFCQLATFDECLKQNAGTSAYEEEKQAACDRLKATAATLGENPNACSACQ